MTFKVINKDTKNKVASFDKRDDALNFVSENANYILLEKDNKIIITNESVTKCNG